MIRSITRALVVLVVFALALVIRDWAFGILDLGQVLPSRWVSAFSSPFEVAAILLFTLGCLAVICWLLLRMPIIMMVITQTYWGGVNVARSWRWETMFTYLNILIFAGVLIAFYVSKRRNLISKAALMRVTCVFAVVMAALWAFPWWLESKAFLNLNQSQIILLISLAVLPFMPVAVTPLLMEKLRHR